MPNSGRVRQYLWFATETWILSIDAKFLDIFGKFGGCRNGGTVSNIRVVVRDGFIVHVGEGIATEGDGNQFPH